MDDDDERAQGISHWLFEWLRDEDSDDVGEGGRYLGAYDSVRRFVKLHRESKRETFIPYGP